VRNIGFVEIVETQETETGSSVQFHTPGKDQIKDICSALRPFFNGLIVANNGFNPESGLKKL